MTVHISEMVKASQAITIANGAAGTTNSDGAILDMAGYDSVLMVVQTGPIVAGAVTSLKVSQDDNADMSSDADISGSKQTIRDTDDNKVFYVDIRTPTKRYLRLKVLRGTQNATVSAMYYQYSAKALAVTQPAGVVGEKFTGPAEGTA